MRVGRVANGAHGCAPSAMTVHHVSAAASHLHARAGPAISARIDLPWTTDPSGNEQQLLLGRLLATLASR